MSEATSTAHAVVVHPPVRGRLRRLLNAAIAMLIGTIVACFVAELAVLLVLGEQPKFPRHVVEAPWGLRYNDPGSRYRHKSADVTIEMRINHQGMRADRDYDYAKPTGVKRIVSLGDSFTMGYEVDVNDTFSAVLERELNSRSSACKVEVLNAGISGFGNAEECRYLERELMKYAPDLVLVSFFTNDMNDNVRSGLFAFDGDRLVVESDRYVPAGGLANYLNTSWFFNLLSERSNAFALAKDRLTGLAKDKMVKQNAQDLERARSGHASPSAQTPGDEKDGTEYSRRLTGAIFERMYRALSAKGIALVVQSIPAQPLGPESELIDSFPLECYPTDRPGLGYVAMKPVLEPLLGKQLIYWKHSQGHWTPAGHQASGKALADLIVGRGMLK